MIIIIGVIIEILIIRVIIGILIIKVIIRIVIIEVIIGILILKCFVGTHLENKATIISGWGISESGFKSSTATETQVRKIHFFYWQI